MMDEDVMSDNSDADCSKDHSKMLSAISKLDYTERIKPATRREPSLQVSEFHLAKVNRSKGKTTVDVQELANALKSPKTLAIRRKMSSFNGKSGTLAKPLEKIVEDKVKRKAGYTKVKKALSRWDSVVEHNRTADQIEFPAKSNAIQLFETNIFASVLKPQTEIEKKVNAMLEESGYRAKAPEAQKEDPYPMTLEEVLAQRREFGNLKRKSIQQQMKAWRQNKIKSKKFHRILRKDKMRQQIKEFEALKEKNPEEALKRLDAIEKSRAHERASLRHKNTGTWAKNLQIRAKYNKDVRQVLAQQIEMSRELTQKIRKPGDESTDEGESDDEASAPHPDLQFSQEAKGGKQGDDISNFLSGYRKFWEEKNKEKSKESKGASNGANSAEEEDEEDDLMEEIQAVRQDQQASEDFEVVAMPKKTEKKKYRRKVDKDENLELMEEVLELRDEKKQFKKTGKILASPKVGKKSKRKSSSGSWEVEESVIDLFDKLEEKQGRRVEKSLKRLKEDLSRKAKAVPSEEVENGDEEAGEKQGQVKKNLRQPTKTRNSEIEVQNSEGTSKVGEVKKKDKTLRGLNGPAREVENGELNIDPTKFLKPKPLKFSQGEMIVVGGEDLDEDPENKRMEKQKKMLAELFADDDVVEEFRKEKEDLEEANKPKEIDMTLPGWGDWGGKDMKVPQRKRKRFILKPKIEAPRKDRNLENVIINEAKDTGIADHQVSDLPYPFTSVKEFEASIRAPIGRTWVPEIAHRKLSAPRVITRAGQKIVPMTEDVLVNEEGIQVMKKRKVKPGK